MHKPEGSQWLGQITRAVKRREFLRLACYLTVVAYLVLCGVTYFSDLPAGTAANDSILYTEQWRDIYEGYTVYLHRAALLCGVALGAMTAAIARERGLSYGLAMLVTGHLGNRLLFMIALPPVWVGNAAFNAGSYYHGSGLVPAIVIWLTLSLTDWTGRRFFHRSERKIVKGEI